MKVLELHPFHFANIGQHGAPSMAHGILNLNFSKIQDDFILAKDIPNLEKV